MRVPGFKRGLPKFDEFSPGVNIIHGPQRSGQIQYGPGRPCSCSGRMRPARSD